MQRDEVLSPENNRPVSARVLLIDDDHLAAGDAERILTDHGFRLFICTDGNAAVEQVQQIQPDVILLNVEMAYPDGLLVLERLREELCSDLPIVMITSNKDEASVSLAYELGATDFEPRPIRWPILSRRLRYLIRSSRALMDVREHERRLISAQRLARLGCWDYYPASGQLMMSGQLRSILELPDNSSPQLADMLTNCHPDDRTRLQQFLNIDKDPLTKQQLEYRILTRRGRVRHLLHRRELLQTEQPGQAYISGTVQDISRQKEDEERIRYLAFHDSLTSLPNRTAFRERLDQDIRSADQQNSHIAVLFMDLDNFKHINDTLGHAAGDQVLVEVAERLSQCLYPPSGITFRNNRHEDNFMLARFGGDEFALILSNLTQSVDAGHIASRLLSALAASFSVMGHEIFISSTIGISIFPDDGGSVESLLKRADTAMYAAKDEGKNTFAFYRSQMGEETQQRLVMETALRNALDNNELQVYYQPIVDSQSGEILSVEALTRWHSEKLGQIPPTEFIPLAESTGLIFRLGNWVLKTAISDRADWIRRGLSVPLLSVNLSGLQLRHSYFVPMLKNLLANHDMPADQLELEITESTLMQDIPGAIQALNELAEMGVHLAVDDFGTGYSSLAYLKRFPIELLKIDKSFIDSVPQNPDDTAIASAIVAMGQTLGLQVVAEGVETCKQLDFVRDIGCSRVQGYVYEQALPVEDLAKRLSNGATLTAEDANPVVSPLIYDKA